MRPIRACRGLRTLLTLVLCLLLPLQAGATLARAAAMAAHGGIPVAPKVAHAGPAAAGPALPQLAHGVHRGGYADHGSDHQVTHHHPKRHHTDHQTHHGHRTGAGSHADDGVKRVAPAGIEPASQKSASHKTAHAKAGCIDCAKCCLLAASAPPSVLPASIAPSVARASFVAQRAPAPAFLTDGPDRPPRHLIA